MNKTKDTFPSPLPNYWGQLHSDFFYLFPFSSTGEQGMGLQSVKDIVLPLLPPHTPPLLQRGCPSHGRKSFMNFSNINHSHRLQVLNCSSVVPPTGCSISGITGFSMAPAWALSWGHNSCQQTCSSVGSFVHGSVVHPEPAPLWASHWGYSLFWAATCSSVRSSTKAGWVSDSQWISVGYKGTAVSQWSSPWAAGGSLL